MVDACVRLCLLAVMLWPSDTLMMRHCRAGLCVCNSATWNSAFWTCTFASCWLHSKRDLVLQTLMVQTVVVIPQLSKGYTLLVSVPG